MATMREANKVLDYQQAEDVDYGNWDYVWGATGGQEDQPTEDQYGADRAPNFGDPKDQTQVSEAASEEPVGPYQNPQTSRASSWLGQEQSQGFSEWTDPYATRRSGAGSAYNWADKYRLQGGQRSGAGSVSAKPYATITENKRVNKSGTAWPTFTAPAYNEGEIKKRQREMASPATRAMEMKVQQAMSKYYENPNVRRAALASTLAGYGIGLSHIMAQAKTGARAEYQADYARQYSEAMNTYNLAVQKMAAQATTVTTSKSFATEKGFKEWENQYAQ